MQSLDWRIPDNEPLRQYHSNKNLGLVSTQIIDFLLVIYNMQKNFQKVFAKWFIYSLIGFFLGKLFYYGNLHNGFRIPHICFEDIIRLFTSMETRVLTTLYPSILYSKKIEDCIFSWLFWDLRTDQKVAGFFVYYFINFAYAIGASLMVLICGV